MQSFEQLKILIAQSEADLIKAQRGNRAAGTRLRKTMQDVKKLAQQVRVEVLEIRDADLTENRLTRGELDSQ